MNFDLSNFHVNNETNGEFLQITSPDSGEPLFTDDGRKIGIYLVGRDSEAYRKAQREITNRRLSRKNVNSITAERLESEANEILAKCTLKWDNIVYEGQQLECNYNNAKRLYDEIPWLKEQVDEFVSNRSNFLKL